MAKSMWYEVVFTRNGRDLTIAENFDHRRDAIDFAHEGFKGADGATVYKVWNDGDDFDDFEICQEIYFD